MNKVYEDIDRNKDDHIERALKLIRQPSVSSENFGVRECAEMLAAEMKSIGFKDVELFVPEPPAYSPIVFGRFDAGARRTLVVDLMYDTHPVAGEKWSYPPFSATVIEMPPFKKVAIARGSVNNKGPVQGFFNALRSIVAVEGNLPVNLLVLGDGEGEIGSRGLSQFIEKRKDELSKADGAIMPVARQDASGVGQVFLGAKGICFMTIECSAKRWGRGPKEYGIYDGIKPLVDNPAWRLVHALSTMTGESGNKILVEGIVSKVAPPPVEDQKFLDEILETFDPEALKRQFHVDRFVDDLTDPREILTRYIYSPTLNIAGITSGIGEDSWKSLIPHVAYAKVSIRLPPNLEFDAALKAVRDHLDQHGFPDIAITETRGYTWSKTSPDAKIAQATIKMLEEFSGKKEVWPLMPATAPYYLYNRVLGLPFCSAGFGYGGRQHSPDEFFVLEGDGKIAGLPEYEKSMVSIMNNFAKV